MLTSMLGFGLPMSAFGVYVMTDAHVHPVVAFLFALPIGLGCGWLYGWAMFKLLVDPGVLKRSRPRP